MTLPVDNPLTPMEKSIILANMIRLADHHRTHCDGETCNISLSYILELLNRAGIDVKESDKHYFF